MSNAGANSVAAHGSNRDPRMRFNGEGSTSHDAPIFSDVAIFGPDIQEFDAHAQVSRPVAAKLEGLFSTVKPDLRLDSAHPHHFADIARGLRVKPEVQRVVSYDSINQGSKNELIVQAHSGHVFLPLILENDKRAEMRTLNTKTGEVTQINIDKEGYKPRLFMPHASAATPTGAVFCWLANPINYPNAFTQMVSYVDATGKNLLWTSAITDEPSYPIYTVGFIHPTTSGDLALLCGWGSKNTRLLILDRNTGEIKHTFAFADDRSFVVNRHSSLKGVLPRIFFNDPKKGTAVVGLENGSNHSYQFCSIDFSTGEMESIPTEGFKFSQTSFVQLSNGKALLLERKNGSRSHRVTFSDDHTFQTTSFEVPKNFNREAKLVVNRNQKFAVAAEDNGLSFYSISDTALEFNGHVALPRKDGSQSTVMTADNVVYHSREVRNENDEVTYRLYAFDAATREELWRVDHVFDMPPEVLVNDDGSITWVCPKTAIILNN